MLRLAFVTGTQAGKWFRRFQDTTAHGGLFTIDADDSMAELLSGNVDVALMRLPDGRVDDSFHVVRLYEETPGIAVPKDSVYAEAGEALALADVSDEHLNYQLTDSGEVDIAAVREALQVVAANVGIAIAPLPLLKILSKKQVVPLALTGSEVPVTEIALVWRKSHDNEAIQDFVGIAKGRTARSSRQEKPKRTAREKAKTKQSRKIVNNPLQKPKKRPKQRKRR
ncbi:LysR family transcriptional regulator [Corynebacterium macginleyi]|uniref:LysR family transcriptional regulator n=1 Tax=Corynebacterium macginleyi TaxID=38290 RepID=A0A3M0HA63_9CORY|nr:LysR family transcriptional regulator substrate-binding protein [Corynebacterium macginleyi]MBK4140245.1 LysR family transcriptional regulator [Corynebacterium macginleyi]MBK4144752.1 LysR family transcriptional regulator [Corynebacterium macginleyi]MBK4150997.1 LysR family transcriptional regulator [Corynebacterium macginleyi]MBK4156509.1 LysR family transcriptional regulator [Corynebacterium macginleyi]MBK4160774.1 LysR family transcriptional regulator [Corynebacterium macginleyi]